MQIGILSGIYVDSDGDFEFSYPINREPVIIDSGISKGFLRPAPGVIQIGTGPGGDRGGIFWQGMCYRVMGSELVTVGADGAYGSIGPITGSDLATMDFSFDRLAIAADLKLWYLFGGVLSQVTDPDLGIVIDMLFDDGYFMTTDGTHLVVTELLDPTSIDPLKYGSAEEYPDPITGLMKTHGEVSALNRFSIENFQNIGGTGFPYQRNDGALIEKGCVGPRAKAYIAQTFAFVGGGKNEAVGVYFAGPGTAVKVSTEIIDDFLAELTEAQLYELHVESRTDSDEQRLIIHLPSKSLVYYVSASNAAKEPVWTILASGIQFDAAYEPRSAVRAYGQWMVADGNGRIGNLSYAVSTQFGEVAGAQFDTKLLYNDSAWAILGELELVGTPGRNTNIFFSYTIDGETWSMERQILGGTTDSATPAW